MMIANLISLWLDARKYFYPDTTTGNDRKFKPKNATVASAHKRSIKWRLLFSGNTVDS